MKIKIFSLVGPSLLSIPAHVCNINNIFDDGYEPIAESRKNNESNMKIKTAGKWMRKLCQTSRKTDNNIRKSFNKHLRDVRK